MMLFEDLLLTKIRGEINKIETRKIIENINKTKSWISENLHKVDKFLARLTQKKR